MKNNTTNSEYKVGRVLIVDDETELMTALCEALAGQGYETKGFTAGADALKILVEQDYDLLLTDLMMPEMDGIALLQAGLEIDPNLVCIIMTGHGTVQTAVEAMKTGAFDYVLKPFKLNALLPLLSRAMEVRSMRMENIQLRETVAIHELGKVIAFSSDLNAILNKVADATLQQCTADEVSIMLPTRDGKELYVAVARGGHREYIGERVPMERGIAGWVARNRETVIINGTVDDPRFSPVNPRNDIRAAVSMPMLAGGNLVGVLNVNITRSHRHMTLGQVKALSILVSIISPILENTWLNIQIRQAEEKYRSIFENANEAIFVVQDGKLVFLNPMTTLISCYSSEELTARPFTELVHPDDRDMVLDRHIKRMKGEEIPHIYSFRIIHKDGKVKWVELNAVLINWNGNAASLNFLSDITERKQAEQELLIKTMLLEAQSETSIDGILAVDNEGHSILFNKCFGELWKIPQHVLDTKDDAVMLGCILKQLKDPEEFSRKVAYLYEQRNEKSRDEVEFADGRYLDRYSSPLLSADGQYLGRIWFFRDITERKQAEDSLKETLESLRKAVNTTIQVMVSAVETRDPYTSGHQLRVATLAGAIAIEMVLPQEKIDGIRMASSIHDIGKLSIPAEILSKPTKLYEIEFSLIKEHALKGYEMLKDVESPWPLAEIVYQHHERMDGSGYPRNLKGDEILMEARIMAVADVVESMASHRPYRAALGIEAALEEIEKNRGILYDEAVTDACLRLFREKGFQLGET